MSVWGDIRRKSLGQELRKEDVFIQQMELPKITEFKFMGFVDSEFHLPNNPTIGEIYEIHGSNKMMIFNGRNWEKIVSISKDEEVQSVFDRQIQFEQRNTVYIRTEENTYEAYIR